MSLPDYYTVLGLQRDARQVQIKKASSVHYRTFADNFHVRRTAQRAHAISASILRGDPVHSAMCTKQNRWMPTFCHDMSRLPSQAYFELAKQHLHCK